MQNVKPVPVALNSLPNEVESKQTKAKLRNWRYPNTLLDDFPCLSMRLWIALNPVIRGVRRLMEMELCFTNKECRERTWGVIPLETFAISVPHLKAVLLFPVLVDKVVGFPGIPILKSHRPPCRHPEEFSLFSLISARRPKMLVAHACGMKHCFFISIIF